MATDRFLVRLLELLYAVSEEQILGIGDTEEVVVGINRPNVLPHAGCVLVCDDMNMMMWMTFYL